MALSSREDEKVSTSILTQSEQVNKVKIGSRARTLLRDPRDEPGLFHGLESVPCHQELTLIGQVPSSLVEGCQALKESPERLWVVGIWTCHLSK